MLQVEILMIHMYDLIIENKRYDMISLYQIGKYLNRYFPLLVIDLFLIGISYSLEIRLLTLCERYTITRKSLQ